VLDMTGNASEMDSYVGAALDPPEAGLFEVHARGGSAGAGAATCGDSHLFGSQNRSFFQVGFRCCADVAP
jgi:hypothetical protein